jgi:hypothetical protein
MKKKKVFKHFIAILLFELENRFLINRLLLPLLINRSSIVRRRLLRDISAVIDSTSIGSTSEMHSVNCLQ